MSVGNFPEDSSQQILVGRLARARRPLCGSRLLIYIYIYIHINILIIKSSNNHTYIYIYIYMYIHVYIYIYLYIYIYRMCSFGLDPRQGSHGLFAHRLQRVFMSTSTLKQQVRDVLQDLLASCFHVEIELRNI